MAKDKDTKLSAEQEAEVICRMNQLMKILQDLTYRQAKEALRRCDEALDDASHVEKFAVPEQQTLC